MAKILIVDDEEQIRNLLCDVLESDNHEITLASTGADGIKVSAEEKFDLIITDLVMPEASGIDLIMEVRKKQPDIKIIAISGGGGIDGRFDYLPIAKLIGAKVIIKKPFQLEELRAAVGEVL